MLRWASPPALPALMMSTKAFPDWTASLASAWASNSAPATELSRCVRCWKWWTFWPFYFLWSEGNGFAVNSFERNSNSKTGLGSFLSRMSCGPAAYAPTKQSSNTCAKGMLQFRGYKNYGQLTMMPDESCTTWYGSSKFILRNLRFEQSHVVHDGLAFNSSICVLTRLAVLSPSNLPLFGPAPKCAQSQFAVHS